MNNKALIVFGIAAVVVVNNGNHGSNNDTADLGCKLRVMGNANRDNHLDSKDVTWSGTRNTACRL